MLFTIIRPNIQCYTGTLELKEGGLTSAPKRDASHRKHNCECYSMRFTGVMLIKNDSKPVKRFSTVFSNKNKFKIVLESVIWAYKFLI